MRKRTALMPFVVRVDQLTEFVLAVLEHQEYTGAANGRVHQLDDMIMLPQHSQGSQFPKCREWKAIACHVMRNALFQSHQLSGLSVSCLVDDSVSALADARQLFVSTRDIAANASVKSGGGGNWCVAAAAARAFLRVFAGFFGAMTGMVSLGILWHGCAIVMDQSREVRRQERPTVHGKEQTEGGLPPCRSRDVAVLRLEAGSPPLPSVAYLLRSDTIDISANRIYVTQI